MKRMIKRILEYMEQYEMVKPGDRVIAAVSGGADSVCLLSALGQIAPELPVSLSVLHVNHGLRGPEADRDEEFVRELCEQMKLPFICAHRDVGGYARAQGMSVEEAGRILRYDALERAAADWDDEAGDGRRTKIAVAHHREDSAETVIFNLLRGSGLRGLSGIRPVQGRLIRPLLCLDKQDILTWLESAGIGWVEDSTNTATAYTRNLIRHRILPLMVEGVNERSEQNILRAAEIFEETDQYMEKQAEKIWLEAGELITPNLSYLGEEGEETGEVSACLCAQVSLDAFRRQEDIMRRYLVRYMIDQVTPSWKDFTSRHFAEIAKLADRQVGSRLDLPCSMTAEVTYDVLRIRKGRQYRPAMEISMDEVTMTVFPWKAGMEIPQKEYTKWFDYDKIKGALSFRSRKEGDYVTLPDGGRKTVARLMIDDKIPREDRSRIPVLAEGHHVLWVVGNRISEYYKITDQTRRVLQVVWNGGEEHGR